MSHKEYNKDHTSRRDPSISRPFYIYLYSIRSWSVRKVSFLFILCQFLSGSGQSSIQYLRLIMGGSVVPAALKFVLKESKSNNWFNDKGQDFVLEIPVNPNYEKKRREFETLEAERRAKEESEQKARELLWTTALERFQSERESRKLDADVTYKSIPLSNDIGEVDVVASFNEKESMIHVGRYYYTLYLILSVCNSYSSITSSLIGRCYRLH